MPTPLELIRARAEELAARPTEALTRLRDVLAETDDLETVIEAALAWPMTRGALHAATTAVAYLAADGTPDGLAAHLRTNRPRALTAASNARRTGWVHEEGHLLDLAGIITGHIPQQSTRTTLPAAGARA